MTKQEFIDSLGAKLAEELSTGEVLNQIQYYQGYIDGEISRGKSEEEAVDALGDPVLIAKTIIETPRSEASAYARAAEAQEDPYFEGAFEAENNGSGAGFSYGHHEEDLSSSYGHHEYTASEGHYEGASEGRPWKEPGDRPEGASEDRSEGDFGDRPDGESGSRSETESVRRPEAEQVKGSVDKNRGFLTDESGAFNWGLFGIIVAAVMILAAVLWIVTKVLFAFGPVILLVLAFLIIFRSIRGGRPR